MTVGADYDRIHRLESTVGQFQIVTHHDNRNSRPHLLDFRGNDGAIEKAQVVLDYDRIHRLRDQEPQAFITAGCGHEPISALLQVEELVRISVDAE